MQTTEEEQQFANQRLCTSPLHKLLGKPNQPRNGARFARNPWCQLQQLKELEAAYQSTQVGKDEVLAPPQS